MNDIMQVNNISKTMSSREIAELCEKRHDHVLRDIRAYAGAVIQMERGINVRSMDWNDNEGVQLLGDTPVEGVTFGLEVNPQNKQSYPVCHLDKNTTLIIVSGYNVLLRKRIIERWQELEQQAQASNPVMPALPNFTNPADAAIAWAEEYKAKEAAQAEVTELKPKAEALARISSSKGATGIRDTAKAVGMRQNDFVAWCVDDTKPISRRFMYRDDRGVLNAYSHRTSAGLMTQKLQSFVGHDGRDRAEPRVKFTPAGVAKIAEMLEKERNKELEPM